MWVEQSRGKEKAQPSLDEKLPALVDGCPPGCSNNLRRIRLRISASLRKVGEICLLCHRKSIVRLSSLCSSSPLTSDDSFEVYVAERTSIFPNCLVADNRQQIRQPEAGN
jgi:hypothetical protein